MWGKLWNQVDLKVVVTILGLSLSGFFFWLTRRSSRKELSFDYEAVRLREFCGTLTEKLVLTFEGVPVANVSLVTIWIRNSGRIPVLAHDFVRPLEFDLKAARLLSLEVTNTKPADIEVPFTARTPAPLIVVDALLLNAGDQITISALITDFDGLSVTGRVVGVRSIERRRVSERAGQFRDWFLISVLCFVLLNTCYVFFNASPYFTTEIRTIVALLSVLAILLVLWVLTSWREMGEKKTAR